MKSTIVKRSVVIGGHKTSVSLEEPFWTELKQIAHIQHVPLSVLVTQIDGTRDEQSNLSSAIRLFVLHQCRSTQGTRGRGARETCGSARRIYSDLADIPVACVVDRRRVAAGEFSADDLAARIGVGDRADAVGGRAARSLTAVTLGRDSLVN